MWKPTIPWGFLDWHSLYVIFHLIALSQSTIINERVSVWCFIWIFVRHEFSLYLRIEALLLSYFSQFYDHLETLLLNLHNFLSTKNWNLFFKQLGSHLPIFLDARVNKIIIIAAPTEQLPIFVLKSSENSICREVCLEVCKFVSLFYPFPVPAA